MCMCPLPKLASASQLPETMVQTCAKMLKEKHTYDKKTHYYIHVPKLTTVRKPVHLRNKI